MRIKFSLGCILFGAALLEIERRMFNERVGKVSDAGGIPTEDDKFNFYLIDLVGYVGFLSTVVGCVLLPLDYGDRREPQPVRNNVFNAHRRPTDSASEADSRFNHRS